ncbi:MAG: ACP S-malonyltransferase [Candidatus Aminicenantes bacterium]|nr:ACP S-malonyltransferase [Candidatus Aminicenantes bacterium]
MAKLAFLFPGQGSQAVGMGRSFVEKSEEAGRLFRQADEILGYGLSKLCFEGPEEELRLTKNTQPALLLVSVAAYRLLGREPAVAAGHSLGEYSALVAAGGLSFDDALRTVHRRGLYMQEAVPVGEGAMAAVLGAKAADLEAAFARVTSGVVQIANWNSLDQIVIAGHKAAVEEALRMARPPRSVMLPVSAPFHSALMKSAEERLAADLDRLTFHDLRFPVVTNVDGRAVRRGEEARDALKRQVSRPVLWYKSMESLAGESVDAFIELGSGKVLAGLIKRIGKGWDHPFSVWNVEDADSLEKTRAALQDDFGRRTDGPNLTK